MRQKIGSTWAKLEGFDCVPSDSEKIELRCQANSNQPEREFLFVLKNKNQRLARGVMQDQLSGESFEWSLAQKSL